MLRSITLLLGSLFVGRVTGCVVGNLLVGGAGLVAFPGRVLLFGGRVPGLPGLLLPGVPGRLFPGRVFTGRLSRITLLRFKLL